jgi:hypothetical protein
MKRRIASLAVAMSSLIIYWIAPTQAQTSSVRDQQIEQYLKDFKSNTKATMLRIPTKYDAKGVAKPTKKFNLSPDELFRKHAQTRVKIMSNGKLKAFAVINAATDNPLALIESPELLSTTLEGMESAQLLSGQSAVEAWSSHYWPFSLGVAANRYADPLFPESDDWTQNQAYTQSAGHSLLEVLAQNNAAAIDVLSPAEKYDAIMGNVNGPFTASMWTAVSNQQNTDGGTLGDWEGVCEGWSSAAIRTVRPAHEVVINDPSGRPITFYPADIKALSSVLWAWGTIETRFIGGRCDQKTPATDANGRITDENCFVTNPATWHEVVTQQLGRLHHPFILDSSDDDEVWNQPAQGFTYSYFNPQTGNVSNSIAAAKVAMSDFTADKFKTYRSPNAASVVGIVMDITYTDENESPTHAATDARSNDVLTTVRYFYDLELDANNKIIGGEWYHSSHPNFLWMPEPGLTPVSSAEAAATGDWNGTGPVPTSWATAATSAASSAGVPLAKVISVLETLSSK